MSEVKSSMTVHKLLVVGSGAAGLMAACAAATDTRVTVLTDRGLGTSNSAVAQGGIQYPLDTARSTALFANDILESAGDGIVDPQRVNHFARSVHPIVSQLLEWGLELDREADESLARRSAGGLSEARLVTANGRIGSAVLVVLKRRAIELGVDIHTQTTVHGISRRESLLVVSTNKGDYVSQTVVLAVGGTSYQTAVANRWPTSNPPNSNELLYDAIRELGVEEMESDRFQYHPFGIVTEIGGATVKCVPESVPRLGSRIVGKSGRSIVEPGTTRRRMAEAMLASKEFLFTTPIGSPVFGLRLDENDEAEFSRRFPRQKRYADMHRTPSGDILITPVLHYQLGGFLIRPNGETHVPGLFLAGEMTGGLHGANRLMGNGLAEAIVDGMTAGRSAARYLRIS